MNNFGAKKYFFYLIDIFTNFFSLTLKNVQFYR